jgi:hypothetical protein
LDASKPAILYSHRACPARRGGSLPGRNGVASGRYGEVMTIMILAAGFAAAIGALAGYVTWRDRHRGGSFVDPSHGRDAQLRVDQQTAHGALAGSHPFGTTIGMGATEAYWIS